MVCLLIWRIHLTVRTMQFFTKITALLDKMHGSSWIVLGTKKAKSAWSIRYGYRQTINYAKEYTRSTPFSNIINDLPSYMNTNFSKITNYADITVITSSNTFPEMVQQTHLTLNKVNAWTRKNGVIMNEPKLPFTVYHEISN